jgi:hypothetical protein
VREKSMNGQEILVIREIENAECISIFIRCGEQDGPFPVSGV